MAMDKAVTGKRLLEKLYNNTTVIWQGERGLTEERGLPGDGS